MTDTLRYRILSEYFTPGQTGRTLLAADPLIYQAYPGRYIFCVLASKLWGQNMRISKMAALGALAVGASVAVAPKADAAYIIDVAQDGNNVVATGSGSLSLSGLTLAFSSGGGGSAGTSASFADFQIGIGPGVDIYAGISGPGGNSFQSSGNVNPSSSTGPYVGVQGVGGILLVPQGYVSGQSLGTSCAFRSILITDSV